MLQPQSFESEVGGRRLSIETGKLAGQANGAVTVRYGDTVVLVTVCAGELREADFLPLTVDYEERLYAAGKIPGGFIRREGRPSEDATLASRLTDRPLRPLMPKHWHYDTQLIITVLSADQQNDPDLLSVIGSSAALTISEIPFAGPVGICRVGYINDQLVLNPTMVELETSQFELVVASTRKAVVMLEAGAHEVSEDLMIKALHFAHEANQAIIELQEQLQQAIGKPKKEVHTRDLSAVLTAISPMVETRLIQSVTQKDKQVRENALNELEAELIKNLSGLFPEEDIKAALEAKTASEIRRHMLSAARHIDGRAANEIRPISCEAGLLPRTHGSALFTRGQTQVLSITTLGSIREEQQLDGLGIAETKRFLHHYNFPPFSTGEVKRVGTPSRREIGHGALVERAIQQVLPAEADFPYTIRIVSEVLSSSGSTSMASTCASSMSLMDAGVPIKRAVAGISIGLVTDDQGNSLIMTDIAGLEDAFGDMDFKVAGTSEGITAIQMDTKLQGVSLDILEKSLFQAREARLSILEIMNKTIASTRPEISKFAPRMYKITIPQEKIGNVIGTGGKTIRSIIEETKTTIDIENDGQVMVGAQDEESARKAIGMIEALTKEVEVGGIYTGKVTRILNFGAMVEIMPGKEGLVHISELADYRVGSVEDVAKVGDELTVKVIGVDNMGRVNLSRKALLEETSPSKPGEAPLPSKPREGGRPPHRPEYRPRPQAKGTGLWNR